MNNSINYKKNSAAGLRIAFSLATLLLFPGCNVGPDYVKPKLSLPKANSAANKQVAAFLVKRWWRIFDDPILNDLEQKALKHNADIKVAIANIEEAAAFQISEADNVPQIALNGDGKEVKSFSKGGRAISNTYSASIGASYELDFFGKYRRADEAAKANLLAQRANKEVVLLSVTSAVAKTYFTLRALDAKLAISRRTFKTRQESYLVYKSRFENGYCTELDYLRVKAEMDSVKSQLLALEATAEKTENALSVLIGSSPKIMINRKTSKSSTIDKLKIPAAIPTELPSSLLARRPDVVMAEENLKAANARIGEAIAENFPSFSLTAAFGYTGLNMGNIFKPSHETYAFAQGISLPIFTGGKLAGSEKAARARYKKAFANYEKAVQEAFRDTLDALISTQKSMEIVESTAQELQSYKRSYDIAFTQKESGLIGLLDLLDVERGLLNKEIQYVEALLNKLNAIVDLCKALGGGWKKKA